MLKVVKIIEGGINLETKEELPRSIVISNGHREVHVPANDIVIRDVVSLFVDNGEPKPPEEELLTKAPNVPQRPPPSPRPASPRTAVTFEADEPASDSFDDEGFEPGEEFSDSGTGASSL